MKVVKALTLLGAVACAPAVLAEATFDPATLGHMKAVLENCNKVNRQQASQYLLQMKALIGGATKEDVDRASKTQAYQVAYHEVSDELRDRSPQELDAACSAYLGRTR